MPEESRLGTDGFVGAHSPQGRSSHGEEGVVAGVRRPQEDARSWDARWLSLHRRAERAVSMVILDPGGLAISSHPHRFGLLKCGQMVVTSSWRGVWLLPDQ